MTYPRQYEWTKIGEVFVDSGTIMVGDPCYYLPDHRDGDTVTAPFALEYFDAVGLNNEGEGEGGKYPVSDHHPDIIDGKGTFITVPSGMGDGSYPVYALIKDDGIWGRRVQAVMVDFYDLFENDRKDW